MTHFEPLSAANLPDHFDVLVVGAGAAGLYAALCLPTHLNVGLVNKDILSLSASDWAQGGIAAAVSSDDSPKLHLEDTLKAGAGLCERSAVEFLVSRAPECIHRLVEMGVLFDRHDQNLALTLEAAHSRHRVLHAADTTGRAVVSILAERVLERQNIRLVCPAFALNLWLDPQTQHCLGLSVIFDSQVRWIRASAVVLATGGGGQVFSQTTNPSVSTGDGVAMAWRSGALLRDLEFFQFHPTALKIPGAPRFLISEAVRGEGAHLIDEEGKRFAFEYHPDGELAPRDVVSRAIFNHLQKMRSEATANGENVWLDLRPIPPEKVRSRFPNIIQVCQQWGVNVFEQPIPVSPAAHYWMGGIATDTHNQTSIPGLYAVGETASTGVHGANRLASNSLLECLVYGAQVGELQGLNGQNLDLPVSKEVIKFSAPSDWQEEYDKIKDIRIKLPDLVWQSAGICRNQQMLDRAISQVAAWRQMFLNLDLSQTLFSLKPQQTLTFEPSKIDPLQLRTWGETCNLLDIAYLILKSSAFRQESRGGHYRQDYPHTEQSWQVHTLAKHEQTWKAPVSP
ncbi:L-aspartate oxidase [Capilliphycus salinus ALCB114379]|uniref:L-aspartate oxidase n=1 Tax=Capilliphycus salinus TaxID=2768948 RepID=UPI0039A69E29